MGVCPSNWGFEGISGWRRGMFREGAHTRGCVLDRHGYAGDYGGEEG